MLRNKKWKKRLFLCTGLLFWILGNSFLQNEIELAYQVNESGMEPGKRYDACILLGGMAGYDKNLTPHFSGACDRFIQANKLYHEGKVKKILIASGCANLVDKQPGEAVFLAEEFKKSGVPPADIIVESNSRNTYENAINSKRQLDSLGLKGPFVLVSSAWHLPRALLVFKKAGVKVVPHPASFLAVEKNYSFTEYLWPGFNSVCGWDMMAKEIFGTLAYKLTNRS